MGPKWVKADVPADHPTFAPEPEAVKKCAHEGCLSTCYRLHTGEWFDFCSITCRDLWLNAFASAARVSLPPEDPVPLSYILGLDNQQWMGVSDYLRALPDDLRRIEELESISMVGSTVFGGTEY